MSKHLCTIGTALGARRLLTLASVQAACACLAACSGDVVDLGELSNPPVASGSLCQSSTTLTAPIVRVINQEQLDQLAGCEAIEGDLLIRPMEGPDFRPLASLRSVGGVLDLGRLNVEDAEDWPGQTVEELDAALQFQSALREAGWIDSLEGLERLERVGGLALRGVRTPDLRALSNLQALGEPGSLVVGPCTGLRELTGLEAMTGLFDLDIHCDTLESLAGLRVPARLGNVALRGAALADLGHFDADTIGYLVVEGTGLENLDGLSGVIDAAALFVQNNERLINADALDRLVSANELTISENARLLRLPDFTHLVRVDTLAIAGNPVLANIPTFSGLQENSFGDFDDLNSTAIIRLRPDAIYIADNPAVLEITFPSVWQEASYVDITWNDQLARIDFSAVESIGRLSIMNNPLLQEVTLGKLATVDYLRAINNPLLPLSVFDELRTFRSELSEGPLPPEQPRVMPQTWPWLPEEGEP
jgi:hypothetical protein